MPRCHTCHPSHPHPNRNACCLPSSEAHQALHAGMSCSCCCPPSCATAALLTLSPHLFVYWFLPVLKRLKEASISQTRSDWAPEGSWPHHVPALVTATPHSSELWARHLLLLLALHCRGEHLCWDKSLARQGTGTACPDCPGTEGHSRQAGT